MRDIIAVEVAKAKNLDEVQKSLCSLFAALREGGGVERIGVITGVISGDGPEFMEQNIKRLSVYTDYIRERHNFPVFSAIDILPVHSVGTASETEAYDSAQYKKFWEEMIGSGLITDIFMTPRWDKSENALLTHKLARDKDIKIHYWDIFDVYPAYRS